MRIVFVCIENAGRSQMAEAFAKKWAPAGVEVFSCGSHPGKALHPVVIDAMEEVGINIRTQKPKGFADLPEGIFDWVIGMGCSDACPVGRAHKTALWELENPKGQGVEAVRPIRDDIERRVKTFFEEIS